MKLLSAFGFCRRHFLGRREWSVLSSRAAPTA